MQQYQQAKQMCGDALLFFRMGDFYELFYEDAKTAAKTVGLTLTSRDKGTNPIPMAGFPHHQLEGYLGKLIKLGFRVAICEQVEDPKKAKGLVKREVTRVVTPGTLTDDGLLDPKENNFLAAVVRCRSNQRNGPPDIGVSWVELSTGRFFAAKVSLDRLADEVTRIAPAELLVSDDSAELGESFTDQTMVTHRPAWSMAHDAALEALAPLSRLVRVNPTVLASCCGGEGETNSRLFGQTPTIASVRVRAYTFDDLIPYPLIGARGNIPACPRAL